jgi:hypothetical protein
VDTDEFNGDAAALQALTIPSPSPQPSSSGGGCSDHRIVSPARM